MKTVNISTLKAKLSEHIQSVRDGEEVIVCDRNQPVARIIPVDVEDWTEHEKQLVGKGVLIPPKKKHSPKITWPEPPGFISDEVMDRVWQEEREGR